MSFIVISDPQVYWRPNAYNSKFNPIEVCCQAMEQAYDYADKEGCDVVVIPGDIVEKQKPDNRTINYLVEFFQRMSKRGINTVVIHGNHDYGAGGSGHPIEDETVINILEKSVSGFTAIDYDCYEIDDISIYGIPYHRHEAEFIKHFEEQKQITKKDTGHKVLIMHQDDVFNFGHTVDPYDAQMWANFDMVFNGHIHAGKDYGKFCNVGSPVEMKPQDATDVRKGFYHVYEHNDELVKEFVPLTGFPRFVTAYNDETVEDDQNYVILKARPSQVVVQEIEDDTKEGRTELVKEFSLKLFNPEQPLPEDVQEEMEKVMSAVPNLDLDVKTDIIPVLVWCEGFRSWANYVELPLQLDKLTYIQAPVGSGKSSLFESMVWAIYGQTLHNNSLASDVITMPRLQELADYWQGTAAGFKFLFNNELFEIVRCEKYQGEVCGVKGESGLYAIKHGETPVILDHTFFGIPAEDYRTKPQKTNVLIDYFLKGCQFDRFTNTVIFTSDMAKLITGKEADTRRLLEPLFNLDWVDEAKSVSKIEAAEIAKQILVAKTNLQNMEQRLVSEQNRLKAGKESREEEIKNLNKDLESVTGQMGQFQQDIYTLTESLYMTSEEVRVRQEALNELSDVNPYTQEVRVVQQAYDEMNGKLISAKRKLSDITLPALGDPEKTAVLARNQIAQDLEQTAADTRKSENNTNSLKRKLEEQKAQMADPNAVTCGSCGQTLPDKETLLRHLKTGIKNTGVAIKDQEKRLKNLMITQTNLGKLLAEAKEQIQDFIAERKAVYDAQVAKQEAVVNIRYSNLQKREKKLKKVTELYDTHRKTIGRQFEDAKRFLKEAVVKHEAIEYQIKVLSVSVEQRKESIEFYKKQIETVSCRTFSGSEIEDIEAHIEGLTDLLKNLANREEIYKHLVTKVFTTTGLKRTIMSRKLDRLNRYAQKYTGITGVNIEYVMEDSGKWEAVVHLNNDRVPARMLSTGQATIANLILIHCIADLQRETVNIPLMLIDEPFSNVDVRFMDQISVILAADTISKYVITHAPELNMSGSAMISVAGGNTEPSQLIM